MLNTALNPWKRHIRSLFARHRLPGRNGGKRRPSPLRPEALEDRLAPAGFDPHLSTLTPTSGIWSHENHPGWDTVNNVAPTGAAPHYSTDEDTALTFNVLAGRDNGAFAVIDPGPRDTFRATAGTFATALGGSVTIAANGDARYTPPLGVPSGEPFVEDSFSYSVTEDTGTGTATVTIRINNGVHLSGRVFDDRDNDGLYEPGDGDLGLSGVQVRLIDQTSGSVIATEATALDGTYAFDVNLDAGTYEVEIDVLAGYLDGQETAGSLGGTVDNTQDSRAIRDIVVAVPGSSGDAVDYLFANLRPAGLTGFVWEDFNDDALINFSEFAIAGAAVTLTGTDDRGAAVSVPAVTDGNGLYAFEGLRPGTYSIAQTQPAGYDDGREALGSVDGVPTGTISANNRFGDVTLTPGAVGDNYNFGERPPASGSVAGSRQTAGIGFWQNNHGQELIRGVNGGASSTQLGDWLAATFANLYGANAGDNNLAGKTNAEVAAFYKEVFRRNLPGPAVVTVLDAQVLAAALAVYVTNENLAGTTAAAYGFTVTRDGVGVKTVNVGPAGSVFGVEDGADIKVVDLLLAVNARSSGGLVFDRDGDADATDAHEAFSRALAVVVFGYINQSGGI